MGLLSFSRTCRFTDPIGYHYDTYDKHCSHYYCNRCVLSHGVSVVDSVAYSVSHRGTVVAGVFPCVALRLCFITSCSTGFSFRGFFFCFFVFVHKTVTNMAATHRQHGRCYHETLCWIEGICVMSWGLRWTVGEIKCKALMRNVQTQAQTWASVSPYADYNEGLIVLTGSGGRRVSEEGGGGGRREERGCSHSCPES